MGRINGTFNYMVIQESQRNAETGFYSGGESSGFLTGCECQIDKSIPAKQVIGTDGQTYTYTYDVFIPKYFKGELSVGAKVQLIMEDGAVDEFTIQGIDNCNRKYIELWG